jgi:poly-gamma-glutamate synthesis protein (capsule biosynthesis protein)
VRAALVIAVAAVAVVAAGGAQAADRRVARSVAAQAADLHLPPEVAVGGRLEADLGDLAPPAALEVRRDGEWRTAGRGETVTARAPNRPGRLLVRGRGADDLVTPAQAVRVRFVRMSAVGDINLGDGPGAAIARFGADYPWRFVGRRLRAADLAFGNLECAVSRRGAAIPKTFTFRGRPSSLRATARRGGLDVVNLANNHAGDFGDTALVDTLRFARRFGIATVGAGRDAREAYAPVIVERLGLRVAFVGFSTIVPFEFRAGADDPGTAWGFPERVRRGVRRARRQADVVVATFHWGIEYDHHQSAQQVALAQTALDAGATAVIGAHPHVPQPIRRLRRRIVAYSMGNFVFTPGRPPGAESGILELKLGAGRVARSHLRRATIVGSRPVLEAP